MTQFSQHTLSDLDLYLIGEGRHERLWEVLGAHPTSEGTHFAVWAPNAQAVSVIGDFTYWDYHTYPMTRREFSGIWEAFVPGVGEGAVYKFSLLTQTGDRIEKADPLALRAEEPPRTASIVTAPSNYQWKDKEWCAARAQRTVDQPLSIYEVHVGSWKIGSTFASLATELVDYVEKMGYTHVEFLPVAEHPFGGSWGYQVSGYYAPTARWGSPDDLRMLIDAFHQRGIGVIIDWVPAHFPKDSFALGRFDGTPCYEHPDPRVGEQLDWGTYVFDFGRNEVRNFLVANALYWCEEFHVDGLRVDAVASMLYLDYSRTEWLPNRYGGRENLEAVQFLQEMNATVQRVHPGVMTIAEESTSWPGVCAPTSEGGLGFSYKWNMGWMNDTLRYIQLDPIYRSYHHNEITFSMVYAYSENYILPISHDEVVHGKGTLWSRMPGNAWCKASGVRLLLAYMWAHPGKTLLFQGQEFAQPDEWNSDASIDWGCLEGWESEYHRAIARLVCDMNTRMKKLPALYSRDNRPEGFRWAKTDDSDHSVLAFYRFGDADSSSDHPSHSEILLCVCNFSGSDYTGYRIAAPHDGASHWECVLNTDAGCYEGGNALIPATLIAEPVPWDGCAWSLEFPMPKLSTQWYRLVSDS